MRDGRLEGLCAMSDGTEQWREPSAVTVEAVNDRTGEHAEIVDAKLR